MSGGEARELLAKAVRDLFGDDCPNEPCPQCKRREDEIMDLADDYAGAGLPADEQSTALREQNDRLRGQLQAVRQLMKQAAANGMIDSQAILDVIAGTPVGAGL